MFRRIRIAFPILVAAFVAYLGVAGAADNPKKEGKAAVVVTEKDDGKKVKLAKGDTLEVRLEMQGGTGFSWKVAKNDDKVLMPKGKPETERPDKSKPGGKLTQIFRFTAEAAGTSEVEVHYARPFEKDKVLAKTFKLTVTTE
jgi:predicted secreted protein